MCRRGRREGAGEHAGGHDAAEGHDRRVAGRSGKTGGGRRPPAENRSFRAHVHHAVDPHPRGRPDGEEQPAADPRGQPRGRAAGRQRQGAVGDARALRLRQRDRGAGRQDDGPHLARARLARHGALRVARRRSRSTTSSARSERPACVCESSSSGPARASTRSCGRCAAPRRRPRCCARPATPASAATPSRCRPPRTIPPRWRGRPARRGSTSSSSGRRRRWWPASATRWPRRACAASARAPRPRGWRARRRSPRRSCSPPACPPRPPHGHHRADGLAAIAGYPAVLKADGLAAGKGVVIAADEAEARGALHAMLVERRFGDAPRRGGGVPARRGALPDGPVRRRARGRAGARARLQAHRRRRPRPEHGRHGRVLARARPGRGRAAGPRAPAGRRRARPTRHAPSTASSTRG